MKAKSFSDFVKKQNFIKELSTIEHIFLWIGCAICLIIFITQVSLFHEAATDWITWLTLFSSVLLIMFIYAGSQKRVICPLLGIIAAAFLLAISWKRNLYGLMLMQGLNIITRIISLIMWKVNAKDTGKIKPKEVKLWIFLVYVAIFIGLSFLWAWMEKFDWFYKFWSGGSQTEPKSYPIRLFESLSLMFVLANIVPMIKGYQFIWWLYIMCDACTAMTWALMATTQKLPTAQMFNCWSSFASYICMMSSCVLAIVNWYKPIKKK